MYEPVDGDDLQMDDTRVKTEEELFKHIEREAQHLAKGRVAVPPSTPSNGNATLVSQPTTTLSSSPSPPTSIDISASDPVHESSSTCSDAINGTQQQIVIHQTPSTSQLVRPLLHTSPTSIDSGLCVCVIRCDHDGWFGCFV